MRTATRFVFASAILLLASPVLADEGAAPIARTTAPTSATATDANANASGALPPLPTVDATPASATRVTVAAPAAGPGVTVIAPLAGGGTMTATGCSNVTVAGANADVRSAEACPAVAPTPAAAAPAPSSDDDLQALEKRANRRDPTRTALMITAPIVFGLGATVAGASYLDNNGNCGSYSSSSCNRARNWLIGYTAISAIVPSTPRMAAGDWTGAALFSAARAGSIITAATIDWGKNDHSNWQGPFLLGFAVPVTLAIVDLATTPRRPRTAEAPPDPASARVTSVAPVAVADASGKTSGAAVSMGGTF